MAVAAELSNDLHIEECPFNEPDLNKIFHVDLFSRINHFAANYAIRTLIVK